MTLPTLPPSAALDALTGALCKGVRRIEYHADEVRAYMKANAGGLAVYWLAHRCKPPRGDRRGIALPSGVSWRCRCGIRWRLDDDIWIQLPPKGRP